MSDTLYLQLDQNIEVTNPHVYLQDIAALSMADAKKLNRLRVMQVMVLDPMKPGRYVMSVSDLLKMILKVEPSINISPIGETDFIITYRISSSTGTIFRYVKIFFVCLVSFFGAAFSIMTFNNDVDLGGLFDQLYTLVMGKSSNGFTVLEISYSVGIGLGVLIFFNHFGHAKLSDDPTPMQVQMRTYEDDVNQTLIEQSERTQNPAKKEVCLPYSLSAADHLERPLHDVKKLPADSSAKSFFYIIWVYCFSDYRSPPMDKNRGANTRDTIVISLIRMLMDGPEVSLNGSPTVSPTTAALCASLPFPP